jgi:hypothetical protein
MRMRIHETRQQKAVADIDHMLGSSDAYAPGTHLRDASILDQHVRTRESAPLRISDQPAGEQNTRRRTSRI